jgi:hypothetical protein
MNHGLVALALQDGNPLPVLWTIIIVAIVLVVLAVVVIVAAVAIFFVMRKRKRARLAADAAPALAGGFAAGESLPAEPLASADAASDAIPAEAAVVYDAPPANFDSPTPLEEIRTDAAEVAAPPLVETPPASPPLDFDPSRTVAISRENTVHISYGSIKFVSGVLAGESFEVQPEGAYIGRESSLAQIVVADPRISKRHLWLGVRDGQVTIVDQESRNGTFVNDPKSERITEAVLHSGDTVILGESDVARFEYHT